MVVEGRHRDPMEHRVVGKPGIGRDRSSAGDLEIEPLSRLGASFAARSSAGIERRGKPPRGSGRAVPLADVGDLHRRRV
jgi:hypothetical protein